MSYILINFLFKCINIMNYLINKIKNAKIIYEPFEFI